MGRRNLFETLLLERSSQGRPLRCFRATRAVRCGTPQELRPGTLTAEASNGRSRRVLEGRYVGPISRRELFEGRARSCVSRSSARLYDSSAEHRIDPTALSASQAFVEQG